MSGAPNINGTSQFPNPPIKIGITIKKIIIKAWIVTIVLKIWLLLIKFNTVLSSNRIKILKEVPNILDQIPKIKYSVPMFLWFVENNHFLIIKKEKKIFINKFTVYYFYQSFNFKILS